MSAGRANAAAERRAVAHAVAWFDRRFGPEAGTVGHVARARGMARPGQLDCIDTMHNTHSLLQVLETRGFLRHHKVQPPVARGMLLDLLGPHATAVLRDSHDNRDWAIDPWTRGYGELPEVMPLEQWMSGE
jgi:hypothetical protein